MAAATIEDTDAQLRQVITNLYVLIAQAHDYQGSGTQQAMTSEIRGLIQNLITLAHTSRRLPIHIPVEIIQYIEDNRNPDIYTREFVELVMKNNQIMKGRGEAFASFRDILGERMIVGIPDIKDEVRQVLEASGGHVA